MKKTLFLLAISLLAFASCTTYQSSGSGAVTFNPYNKVNVSNNWEVIPGSAPITYTIDISTPEGWQKLNNKTLEEAQQFVLTEAVQQYGLATIVNPSFTQLQKGKRKILRITVSGLPAYYKNAGYFNKQTEHPGGNSNINVRINQ